MLFSGVAEKFAPTIVTDAPTFAVAGVKSVIVGAAPAVMRTNCVSEVAVPPAVVTVIGPIVAPEGTITASDVAVAAATVAGVPLKLTVFIAAAGSKFAPLTVIINPAYCQPGANPVIKGAAFKPGDAANDPVASPPGDAEPPQAFIQSNNTGIRIRDNAEHFFIVGLTQNFIRSFASSSSQR